MLVKNLIKRLEKMNPEAQVRISYKDGEVLLFVMAQAGHDDIVWLESESDCDMISEIQARFDDAIENGTDELDVYTQMLEDGIDVDIVRRYLGDQAADHMQKFCESHGLIGSYASSGSKNLNPHFLTGATIISRNFSVSSMIRTGIKIPSTMPWMRYISKWTRKIWKNFMRSFA